MGPALWHMLASLALGRWRLEDQEFKANLCYIARPCLKPKTKAGAEDVSVVKHLSCKHEDQSSNPQHPHRKMGMPCIPATQAFGIETGRSHESDTLVKAENFQFRERISRHPSLASACVHGHTLTCITACTPTHTHIRSNYHVFSNLVSEDHFCCSLITSNSPQSNLAQGRGHKLSLL